jgi:hypothetical protein
MSNILFEVTRFKENNEDYISVKGIESDFNQVAKIDIQWNEVRALNKKDLSTYIKNVKQAVEDTIHNTLNVKRESQKDSLLTNISDNINNDLHGVLDDQIIYDLRARVEIP